MSCGCHESGFLEIKCPWTDRDKSVIDYAKLKESCLEVIDNVIVLKKLHSYNYDNKIITKIITIIFPQALVMIKLGKV